MNLDLKYLGGMEEIEAVKKKRSRLMEKWTRTRLLNGMTDVTRKENMAQLLENEARWLLTEANTEASALKGFQNIAFPLVRRIFGGLVANELVSVQPMSLPSGLLFYLDYQFSRDDKAGGQKLDWTSGGSVYGDQVGIGTANLGTGGHYNLGSSYSKQEATGTFDVKSSGTVTWSEVGYDPDLSASIVNGTLFKITVDLGLGAAGVQFTTANLDETNYKQFSFSGTAGGEWDNVKAVYRRHNAFVTSSNVATFYFSATAMLATGADVVVSVVKKGTNSVTDSGLVHTPAFESTLSADPVVENIIPEIDIKIQSVAVTAQPRKLKAKWTPELAQDLNAFHNVDAEVELTRILSEQIAIDIDNEILEDIYQGATAANFFWSREPGQFVNKETGAVITGPSFTGNVREWYETLIMTIHDVANVIHKKTLRSSANFIVCSPEVSTILESLHVYKPALSLDGKDSMFGLGTEKIGSLNNRYTVYKSPYVSKNKILVGYKGGSFLETGYVYAPYVPLIVTPTIFAPEDFTPRKAVMTRYAKKMVRSDYFGTVTVRDMNVL